MLVLSFFGGIADDHKILYNYKTMTLRLEEAGFKVILLEYWDENGLFHFVDWSDESGHIIRSKRYDVRNKDGKLNLSEWTLIKFD